MGEGEKLLTLRNTDCIAMKGLSPLRTVSPPQPPLALAITDITLVLFYGTLRRRCGTTSTIPNSEESNRERRHFARSSYTLELIERNIKFVALRPRHNTVLYGTLTSWTQAQTTWFLHRANEADFLRDVMRSHLSTFPTFSILGRRNILKRQRWDVRRVYYMGFRPKKFPEKWMKPVSSNQTFKTAFPKRFTAPQSSASTLNLSVKSAPGCQSSC